MVPSDLDKELRDTVLRCAFRRNEIGVILFKEIEAEQPEEYLLKLVDERNLLDGAIASLIDPSLTASELLAMISTVRNNHYLEKVTLTSDEIEEIFLTDDRIVQLQGAPGATGARGAAGGGVLLYHEDDDGRALLKVGAIVDEPQDFVGQYIRADGSGYSANPALAKDYTGPAGNNAWTMIPVFGEPEEDGSVFATYSYVGGEGDKPANDGDVIVDTEDNPVDFRGQTGAGTAGATGASGANGWQIEWEFPVISGKKVIRAGAWFGGTGTAPTSVEGQYLSPDGWTASLAEATAVGSTASGSSKHIQVRVAQLTNLAGTYTAGEITGSGSALSVDSTTIEVDDIVLLGGQTNPIHNGLYVCTVGGDPWTLVRHESFDTDVSARLFVAAQVLSGTSAGLTLSAKLDQVDFEIGDEGVTFYQSKPNPLDTSQLTEPRQHLLQDADGEIAFLSDVAAVQSAINQVVEAIGATSVEVIETTNATEAEQIILTPAEDSHTDLEVRVVAVRTGGTGGDAGDYMIRSLRTAVSNIGGTVTIETPSDGPGFGDQPWVIALSEDDGDILIGVTGEADVNITWRITVIANTLAFA